MGNAVLDAASSYFLWIFARHWPVPSSLVVLFIRLPYELFEVAHIAHLTWTTAFVALALGHRRSALCALSADAHVFVCVECDVFFRFLFFSKALSSILGPGDGDLSLA